MKNKMFVCIHFFCENYLFFTKLFFPWNWFSLLTSGGNAKKANPYSLAKPGRPVNDDGRAAHFALGMVSEKWNKKLYIFLRQKIGFSIEIVFQYTFFKQNSNS